MHRPRLSAKHLLALDIAHLHVLSLDHSVLSSFCHPYMSRVICKERETSGVELPPLDWPGGIFLIANWRKKA